MQRPDSDQNLPALLRTESESLFDELVEFRRDLHANPEIGHDEHRTTHRIVSTLGAAGLTAEVLPVGTGAVCDVLPADADPGDPLVAFRADIDALPIPDHTDVAWASTRPGVCHACGHDVHTTVVLGLGLLLQRMRERGRLAGGVRLIFQPAEELSPGGALDAIEGGALKNVREVYALHCDPRLDVGRIGIRVGAVTSASDRVHVQLSGTGGHTSRPHLTADLVGALGALATTAPLVLSRRVDPRSAVSLVWGRVAAGSVANAIPQTGELEGTLRAVNTDGWHAAGQLLPEICRQIVAPYGVGVEIAVTPGVPPTVNHAEGVDRLRAAADAVLGPDSVVPTEQSLGGEDFGWMLQQVPGAMARLGVRTPGRTGFPDIHQPTFVVDERCIDTGVQLLSAVALGTSSY